MTDPALLMFPPMPTDRASAVSELGASLYAASTGEIEPVATDFLRRVLGPEVADGLLPVDSSVNLLREFQRQLSTPPLFSVTAPTADGAYRPTCTGPAEEMTRAGGILDQCGAWPMLSLMVTRAIGINFCAVAVDRDTFAGQERVALREVPPQHLYREPHPADPRFPSQIWERRIRQIRVGRFLRKGWTWDQYDLSGEPSFRIVVASGFQPAGPEDLADTPIPGQDVTAEILGLSDYDPAVPYWPDSWRREDGTPRYPFVFMHIEETGDCHPEVAAAPRLTGTLAAIRADGNSQRAADRAALGDVNVLVGLDIGTTGMHGGGLSGAGATKTISIRPGSTVMANLSDGGQAQQFTLGGGLDLHTVYQYGAGIKRDRMAGFMGVSGEDNSGALANPESAGALSIKGSARRDYIRREVLPRALQAFSDLCALVAAVNGLPQTGYSVSLEGQTPSASEQAEQAGADKIRMEAGLISRVDVYRREYPGTTREDAISALALVDATEALIKAQVAALTGQAEDPTVSEQVGLARAELEDLAPKVDGEARQAILNVISILGGDVSAEMDEDQPEDMTDQPEDTADPPTSPGSEDAEVEDA